jgi:hypothetical protein
MGAIIAQADWVSAAFAEGRLRVIAGRRRVNAISKIIRI